MPLDLDGLVTDTHLFRKLLKLPHFRTQRLGSYETESYTKFNYRNFKRVIFQGRRVSDTSQSLLPIESTYIVFHWTLQSTLESISNVM